MLTTRLPLSDDLRCLSGAQDFSPAIDAGRGFSPPGPDGQDERALQVRALLESGLRCAFSLPGNVTVQLGGRLLHLEGRAVRIIAESLADLVCDALHCPSKSGLSRQNRIRLTRAKAIIAADPAAVRSVARLARQAGASCSALQRLFRRVEGCSVFGYVRRARLERAHAALRSGDLCVREAAVLAGYSSGANFATSFRRTFGLTPSEARRR